MAIADQLPLHPEPPSDGVRAVLASSSAPQWCQQLFNDPNVTPIANPAARTSARITFVEDTLSTETTISTRQWFYRDLSSSPREGCDEDPCDASDDCADAIKPAAFEILFVLALGKDLEGHHSVVHGGLIATMMDHTSGMLPVLYHPPGTPTKSLTAYLNIKYRKPARIPGIVLCRAWLERNTGGRKFLVRGKFEDSMGDVCAETESLFINLKTEDAKL